jgi:hypothetical protein
MVELATGHFTAQVLIVAARLGIADLLRDGPKTAGELSRLTGAHARSLYRLLRALSGTGVFAEDGDGRFFLTPLGDVMRTDSPDSVRAGLLLAGRDFHWGSWTRLEHSVMTGECAFEHLHDAPLFEHLARNPDDAAVYNAWMTRASRLQIPAILGSFDFSAFPTVVDVGGGHGSLLAAVLKAHPGIRGILFDLPEVVKAADEIEGAGVGDRCEVIGGDFFEYVPAGGDLYILKTVIHDWNDELAVKILGSCRKAMSPASRLLVIESVVPPGNEPHASWYMDLNMLVLTRGGLERTEAEYRALFAAAGFRLESVIPTPSPLSLMEGRVVQSRRTSGPRSC